MKFPQPPVPDSVRRLVERCAWCRASLVPEMQVVIVGGRFATWSPQLERLRGQVIQVETRGVPHAVSAVAPLAGTSAQAAGYDVLFVVCSRACRDGLDAALRGEPIRLIGEGQAGPEPRAVN